MRSRNMITIFKISDFTVNSFRFAFKTSDFTLYRSHLAVTSVCMVFLFHRTHSWKTLLPADRETFFDKSSLSFQSCNYWNAKREKGKSRRQKLKTNNTLVCRRPRLGMQFASPFSATRSIFTKYQRFNRAGWYQLTKLDNPTLITKWMARPDNR